jgi:hypothetical protein
MAIYAKIENNIVTNIIVCEEEKISELSGVYIECSEDGSIRYNYPSIGWIYDSENDAFIPPKIFESWVLNSNYKWEAPISKPEGNYFWNDSEGSWVEIA